MGTNHHDRDTADDARPPSVFLDDDIESLLGAQGHGSGGEWLGILLVPSRRGRPRSWPPPRATSRRERRRRRS